MAVEGRRGGRFRRGGRDAPHSALTVVPQAVVYIAPEVNPSSFAKGLREWAERPGVEATAFAAMYDPTE